MHIAVDSKFCDVQTIKYTVQLYRGKL